jgi:hypothetical protein
MLPEYFQRTVCPMVNYLRVTCAFSTIWCIIVFPLPVAQQSNSGLGSLTVEVTRSHSLTHSLTVGLIWTSDQPVAEAATYTTHNTHKSQTSLPPAGFEPTIPASEWSQTYNTVTLCYLVQVVRSLPITGLTLSVQERIILFIHHLKCSVPLIT